MKILFCPAHYLYDEYYGGSEPSATFNICDRVAKKYPESLVVTGCKKLISEKCYRVNEIQKNKCDLEMSQLDGVIFNIKYTLEALACLRKEEFDIIHHVRPFNLFSTFNIIPILGLNKKTPFIVGSFASPNKGSIPVSQFKKVYLKNLLSFVLKIFFSRLAKILSIKTLQKSDHIFVYDNELKQKLIGLKIPKNKITVAPPGKDKNVFYPNKLKKKFIVIAVSNLISIKRIDLIIKGFFFALKKDSDIELQVIGEGIEKKKLIKLVNKLNIEDKVLFCGHVENRDLPSFYREASLFVHMAEKDSYGQVYIEALASGLPIVTSKNDGARRILKNVNCAKIIEKGDWQELGRNIILYKKNLKKLEIDSVDARNYFESKYDWDSIIIKRYLQAYQHLLGKK